MATSNSRSKTKLRSIQRSALIRSSKSAYAPDGGPSQGRLQIQKKGGALRAPSQIVLQDLQAAKSLVQRTRMPTPSRPQPTAPRPSQKTSATCANLRGPSPPDRTGEAEEPPEAGWRLCPASTIPHHQELLRRAVGGDINQREGAATKARIDRICRPNRTTAIGPHQSQTHQRARRSNTIVQVEAVVMRYNATIRVRQVSRYHKDRHIRKT